MGRLTGLFRNRLFLLLIVTIILLVIMGVSFSNTDIFKLARNMVNVPLSLLQGFFSTMGQKVEYFFSTFKEIKTLKEENEKLKIRVNELEKENRELIGFREKNEELREALKLKSQFEDYEIIGANVIAKDPGNWFDVFTIDIGKKDGIDVDYPVITSTKGLVGRVISSDLTSSKVISIIDEDSVISCWLSKIGGGHVIVKGDLTLKEEGLCHMYNIPANLDVAFDDVIETSGLGGIYPKGILVGRVKEIRQADSELDRYGIIEPEVNLKKLQEVFVLKKKDNKG
ncbi:MAG TPA: rod shape-determining protein MreC [Clostridiaceae bacterium]|nr:rod shape-determining protein MreC [Clostridiaceae bacterium]